MCVPPGHCGTLSHARHWQEGCRARARAVNKPHPVYDSTEEPFPSCLALPNMSLGISSLLWEESSLANSFTAKKFSSWRTLSQVGCTGSGAQHIQGGQDANGIVNFPGKRNEMFPNRCVFHENKRVRSCSYSLASTTAFVADAVCFKAQQAISN